MQQLLYFAYAYMSRRFRFPLCCYYWAKAKRSPIHSLTQSWHITTTTTTIINIIIVVVVMVIHVHVCRHHYYYVHHPHPYHHHHHHHHHHGHHNHQYHHRRRRSRRRCQEHLEGGRPSLLHLLYSPHSENPIFHPPHHHHNYNDMTCGVLLFLTVRTRLEWREIVTYGAQNFKPRYVSARDFRSLRKEL